MPADGGVDLVCAQRLEVRDDGGGRGLFLEGELGIGVEMFVCDEV